MPASGNVSKGRSSDAQRRGAMRDSHAAHQFEIKSPVCEHVARKLPVSEYVYTQLGPGDFEIESSVVRLGDVQLLRTRIEPLSAGVVVPDADYVAFLLPLSWTGQYLYNGIEVTDGAIFMSAGRGGYHTVGTRREGFSIGIPKVRFVDAIAALRGIHPDEVVLCDGELRIGPVHASYLRSRLADISRSWSSPRSPRMAVLDERHVETEIYDLLLGASLKSGAQAGDDRGRERRAIDIVRAAEERFVRARGGPVSLADLCLAAGVARTALYRAFHHLYGESPLRYFHRRRLMQARDALLVEGPARGAVKRAALGAGLTSLGRFSAEYAALFGEPPSATLDRAVRIENETG